jgi:hypothetical protein
MTWSRGPFIPDDVECAGCGRRLEVKAYRGYPKLDTPADRITDVRAPHHWALTGVLCTCGHYTIYRPMQPGETV